jgi:hypothetical protein
LTLSNAERQRRYIARLKEKASVTNDSVTNEVAELKAFADQLGRKNAELEEWLDTVTNEVDELLASVTKLERKNAELKRGVITAAQFKVVRKCLHPDIVYRLQDEELTKQFNEAFKIFNGLRRLIKPKDPENPSRGKRG